jgi:hypothetical protein
VKRRKFVLAAACLLPVAGYAQSAFIGQWQGEVDGVGKARLIITGVKANGQVEGRMQFDFRAATFGDKVNIAEGTSYGVVSGTALQIDSAVGGHYDLVLSGSQLSGTYSRGTTLRGRANFTKT